MPVVDAYPQPNSGIVQLDVDMSDLLGAEWVRLERVMADTGEVTIIRPNTSYNGDYMQTSAGFARFFDTDAPTDRTFTYQVRTMSDPDTVWPAVTTANAISVIDTFTRTVGAGTTWGTPDRGAAYTALGTTTEALVSGGEGTLSVGAENVLRGQWIDSAATREQWDMTVRVGVDAIPTGDHHIVWFYLRSDAALDNYVALGLMFRTTGVIGYTAAKEVGGSATNLVPATVGEFTYDATTNVNVRVQAVGDYARMKMWLANGGPEPAAWTFEVFVPDVPKVGRAAIVAFVPTASSSALPVVFDFDNLRAFGANPAEGAQYMLDSLGEGWLRDPINPCHNVRLATCIETAACATSQWTFEGQDLSRWGAVSGTIALSPIRFKGRQSLELTANGSADPRAEAGRQRLAVVPGRWVWVKGWLMAPTALNMRISINWFTAGGGYVTTSAAPFSVLTPGVWEFRQMLDEAPATAAFGEYVAAVNGSPVAGTKFYLDTASFDYREPSTSGVFFASLDEVSRATQAETVAIVGDALPVNVSLPRRAPSGSFTLVSRSFEDRDDLVTLLAGGNPVQLDMPEVYGIPTMTLAVGDVGEARGVADHRYQPRVHTLPYVQVREQVGPANGPCGAKYEDFCANPNLDTWAEANAAGMTYNAMIDVT